MIRMFREDLERLTACLMRLRAGEITYRNVLTWASGLRGSDSATTIAHNAVRQTEHPVLDDQIAQLVHLIETDRNSSGAADMNLIDSMVRILQLPYPRNLFGRAQLIALREALLTPDERLGLADRLRNKEMSCGKCGHHFTEGELATLAFADDVGAVFYCYACLRPTYVSCSTQGCDSQQLFTDIYTVRGSKLKPCSACTEKKAGPVPPPSEPQGNPADEPQRGLRTMTSRFIATPSTSSWITAGTTFGESSLTPPPIPANSHLTIREMERLQREMLTLDREAAAFQVGAETDPVEVEEFDEDAA